MEQQKYWYRVSLSAEGDSSGYVHLTKEEAEGAKKASDTLLWHNAQMEAWSGFFWIDTDNPLKELPKSEEQFYDDDDDFPPEAA